MLTDGITVRFIYFPPNYLIFKGIKAMMQKYEYLFSGVVLVFTSLMNFPDLLKSYIASKRPKEDNKQENSNEA